MKSSIASKGMFSSLPQDLRAGLIVFLVAVPLCLGISAASNAPVMSGIIAGAIGGIVIGLLGGSQLGVSGPAAGLVAVVIAAQQTLGSFEALLLATLIAGGMQVLMGLARLGTIAYFFPSSVIKGMLAAIGVIIIMKQLPHAFGYDKVPEGMLDFWQQDGYTTLSELEHMFHGIEPGAMIIAAVGMAILILWELPFFAKNPIAKVVPAALIAVAVGVGLQLLFISIPRLDLEGEHLVFVDSSNMSSWFSFPAWETIKNGAVWTTALIIAGVASVESLLCAEATDKLDPHKRITPMNKELMAQGVGNLLSGLIGGLPVTQVIVRSSANVQSGAQTRMAAVFHGLLIVIAVLVFPFILNHIPKASLAAVLIMVGYKLAKPALFKLMWKKGIGQFLPFVVTILAILFTDLLIGIGIGMVFGIGAILYKNFSVPYFLEVKTLPDGRKDIRITFSEVVSFLNKGAILETFRALPSSSRVTLDRSRCVSIDNDVEEAIQDFVASAKGRDIEIVDERTHTKHKRHYGSLKTLMKALKSEKDPSSQGQAGKEQSKPYQP